MILQAPFPWFGGKSRVAHEVWPRFGPCSNYVEPFFGSGAVLLARPGGAQGTETVNDKDGFVCNAWRAIKSMPDETAEWADWPVNENDLHARHVWLVERREALSRRLEGDPDYCDPKIAGWWLWGISCWIGGGWCAGRNGPWGVVEDEDGVRQLVHLGDAGQGVQRRLVHLARGRGVQRKRVHLGNAGRGVKRKLVHLGDAGRSVSRSGTDLDAWFAALSERMRRVRVCCGDWSRVCGPTPTTKFGLAGVFLDPPYSAQTGRDADIYATEDLTVAQDVAAWCREHGDDPLMRIALCGYDGEHDLPGWECVAWKAAGGYGLQSEKTGRENARRERIWFSPHCLRGRLL